MLKKIFSNSIIQIIVILSAIAVIILSIYIPKVTEKNTIDLVTKNSRTIVEQIMLTREYYVREVVGDVKAYAPNIKFDYEHAGVDGKIAFPTSLVHELSDIYSQNTGTKIRLYSNFPFKPKEDRVLSEVQKEALSFIGNSKNPEWIKRDIIKNKEVLRVAIPDIMTEEGCVSCHNTHSDRTWEKNKWELGDTRGVIEIITPIDDALEANNDMKNNVILLLIAAVSFLIIIYSYFLLRRENELLCENEILDKKVADEVKKNLEKEKQLILQNRSAAMGEMLAAIIHQWKQPLNGISMANSAIDLEMQINAQNADAEFVCKKTNDIRAQIDNMTNTLDDFKNFFKPQNKTKYSLSENIIDTVKMVEKIYENQKIKIALELEENIMIEGYPNELSQVLINILNNARDIIEEKQVDIKKIFVSTKTIDNKINICIKDCAGGIPEDVMDKIFDPYFTTKDADHGTGIGLDMSKNIIEKVNGTIEVCNVSTKIEDKEYKGARFTIKLPI